MKSHVCEFEPRDLFTLLGLPLLPVALFAALMHAGVWLRVLPTPRPTLDVDHTILIHQAEASRSRNSAEVVLIGDSSCLMDVSAKELGQQLGHNTLNLGSFSYLDLDAYALMLGHYVRANPGQLRAVVLLMHPEALRRTTPESYYVEFLKNFFEGRAPCRSNRPASYVYCFLGADIFKGCLLSRILPAPFRGSYGRYYGFSDHLERFLTDHHGSALDPESRIFQGNAEYRLARQLQPASRVFKAAIPAGVKLIPGITPVPEKFAGTNYSRVHQQMLDDWSHWLDAEALKLPATLPDRLFAKTTHLNEEGVRVYTEILAEALKPHLR
jgi:hypothetical protein